MKVWGQIFLAVTAIVLLVAGVTYLSHYGPSKGGSADDVSGGATSQTAPSSTPQPQGSADLTLSFPAPVVEWEPTGAGHFEQSSTGHYDFWFTNRTASVVDLGLHAKSCKCADIAVAVLSPDEAKKFSTWLGTSATLLLSAGFDGVLSQLANLPEAWQPIDSLHGLKLVWQPMEISDTKGAAVPLGGAGLLRLHWAGKPDQIGMVRLTADLWTQAETGKGRPRLFPKVEVPITYVHPLRASLLTKSLEEFAVGEEKSCEFSVWSPTRASFSLEAFEKNHDPLVICSTRPLTPEECQNLAATQDSRVLTGYQLKVSVRERLSDSQRMDLGPFHKRILLKSDVGTEDVSLQVTGLIRGEITVGADEDKGKINLMTFRTRNGLKKSVPIVSEVSGIELQPEGIKVEPESIQPHVKVRLEKVGSAGGQRTRWVLHLDFQRSFPLGVLPENSAIYVAVTGAGQPRQVRIPMVGKAYQ